MDTPLTRYERLAAALDGDASIEQAVALTEALNAIPELQSWLRARRQKVVLEVHEAGMSYTEMAPHLGVKPERVSGIARGHSRSGGRRIAETTSRPVPPSEDDRAANDAPAG